MMSTRDKDQKSDKSQHARPISDQKSGKGSGRYDDDDDSTSPVNRGKTEQKRSGNDPQSFSSKISESKSSDKLAKPQKNDTIEDDDHDDER
jgi:hypothetical protein